MLPTKREAAAELLRRRESRRKLAAYIGYTSPKYKPSGFSAAVCAALDKFVDDMQAGKRPILVLQAPPQHGKLIADYVPVLTTVGWKTHGELAVGDKVFHPSGRAVSVVAVSPALPANVKVTFGNGESIHCHERHEWLVFNRNKKREEVIETSEMLARGRRSIDRTPLYVGEIGKRGCHYVYKLPKVAPIQCAHAELPVHPYALGVWLGDGTQTKAAITYADSDRAMIQELARLGYPARMTHVHKTTGVLTTYVDGLRAGLIACGVFAKSYGVRNKHIPDSYLCASIEQRLDLLAGLIDTDGYTYRKNGRVVFTTADDRLASTFCELLSTFGWNFSKVTEAPKLSSSGIAGVREYYVIGFNATLAIPCRLTRKRNVPCENNRRVAIVDIVADDAGHSGRCIQVDADDGLYLIGRTMQPTHNSEIVSRKLPPYLLGRFPDWKIGAFSYSDDLSGPMSLDVRRNMASDEHRRLFPAATERRKFDVNRDGEFTAPGGTGGYIGRGVGSGATGRSLDVGIIDDPIKDAKEALSPTTKEGIWNWYQTVFKSRLSEHSGQIIMATSWAEDDLSARAMALHAGDARLTVLKFPAINEPGEVGYNPILPPGALVPDLHSLRQLQEFKAEMSDYWWAALYQQSPRALGGNVFKEEGLRYYLPKDLPAKFDKVVASLDATFKDTDGTDFVVFQVWGKLGANSYLLEQSRARMSFTKTISEVVRIKRDHPRIRQFYIEDKANGPAVIDALKGVISGLIPVEPDGSKLARAHAVTHVWEAGNVWLPHPDLFPWVKDLVAELTAFPAAANDDQVDAMTQALRQLYPLFNRLKISQAALDKAMGR